METLPPLREAPIVKTYEEEFKTFIDYYLSQMEDENFGGDLYDEYAASILDEKYEKVDVDGLTKERSHLTESQQEDLHVLFKKHEELFSSKLGYYPHRKFHIEIEQGAQPVHARSYPVPHLHKETFKKELDHLVEIGVLDFQGASEWASPTFIQEKKDCRFRWLRNLRALNKVIKKKQYLLLIIHDILRKRKG